MMDDLYQELIIDHGTHPRRLGKLPTYTHQERGFNPLCGDELNLYLEVEDHVVKKVRFEGKGCAISMASASLMGEKIEGMPVDEVKVLFSQVHRLLSGENITDLGKIEALAGVCKYPMRVKCATLAWHTLVAALDTSGQVSTEEAI